jgi:hypothetical protein
MMGEDTKATLAFRCVDLQHGDVPDLQAMVERARAVSFETFARKVDYQELARQMGYAVGPGQQGELRLGDDRAARFYSSTWRGAPVYFMVHSAIEFVFRAQRADQVMRPPTPWGGMLRGNTEGTAPEAARRRPRPR